MAAAIAKGVKPLLPELVHSQKVGVVVSAGKMAGAVKVRVAEQEWNKKFRKHFPAPKNYLVRDPNSSLVPGDVVRISSGNPSSKKISHVVTSIVAPFGAPVEDRPPVLSQAQLDEQRLHDKLLKDVRSAARGRQASVTRLAQARRMGLQIPSLEEAERKGKEFEEDLRRRGVRDEAHRGQAGQEATKAAKKKEERRIAREEKKAEEKVKSARRQKVEAARAES